MLDYGRRRGIAARINRGRGALLVAALVTGVIAIGLFGGLVELLVVTWPDFGATLIAVPVMLGATAFGIVAVTSFRVAMAADASP